MTTRDELSEIEEKKGDHTELMRAALEGNTATVNTLLAGGADVNAIANDGATALILAASSGDTESVRALLRRGAGLGNRYSQSGETALMLAKKNNHTDIVELLSGERVRTAGV